MSENACHNGEKQKEEPKNKEKGCMISMAFFFFLVVVFLIFWGYEFFPVELSVFIINIFILVILLIFLHGLGGCEKKCKVMKQFNEVLNSATFILIPIVLSSMFSLGYVITIEDKRLLAVCTVGMLIVVSCICSEKITQCKCGKFFFFGGLVISLLPILFTVCSQDKKLDQKIRAWEIVDVRQALPANLPKEIVHGCRDESIIVIHKKQGFGEVVKEFLGVLRSDREYRRISLKDDRAYKLIKKNDDNWDELKLIDGSNEYLYKKKNEFKCPSS